MKINILRARIGVPGVGRMLTNRLRGMGFDVQEVVCRRMPERPIEPGDVIINYGRSTHPVWDLGSEGRLNWLNHPDAVFNCVDKIRTLSLLTAAGIPTVEWTTDQVEAEDWLINYGSRVFVRHTSIGKAGAGIELLNATGLRPDVPDAPLYTREFPSNSADKVEFRVHVFNGKVIDYVQKKMISEEKMRDRGWTRDMDVRNHKRGWTFAHNNILQSQEVAELAIRAANRLGMDYCAADLIGELDGMGGLRDIRICEVNSAPGMSNTTTRDAYLGAFSSFARSVA